MRGEDTKRAYSRGLISSIVMFAGPYMIELHVTSLGCRSGRLVGLMRHFCETPYVTDCRSIIISLYVHHWGLLFGGGSPRPRGRGRD